MSYQTFVRGALSCAPVAASVIPFGIITAASGVDAGMSAASIAGLSLIVFAGASQLAAISLAGSGAPALFVIGAAIVVNLRFAMYSAALAPHVCCLPRRTRAAMAYLLTDQAFALAVPHLEERPQVRGTWFFFGAGVTLWLAWQAGTLIGIACGASLPPELSLDFSVALAFIALVVPHLKGRPELAAATASIVVYVLASGLPYGLALLPASGSGIAAGMLAQQVAR